MKRYRMVVALIALALGCGDNGGSEPTNATPNNGPNNTPNNDPNNDPNGGTNTIVEPIIVHPCEFLSEDAVAAAAGVAATETTNSADDDNREECEWTLADDTRVFARSAKRSNAQDFYDGWDGDTADYTDKSPLAWSPKGELRSSVIDGATHSHLFAFVIDTDPLGRDVYIELRYAQEVDLETGQPFGLPLATQQSMLEALGLELSKATRMEQPEGVELPDVPQE